MRHGFNALGFNALGLNAILVCLISLAPLAAAAGVVPGQAGPSPAPSNGPEPRSPSRASTGAGVWTTSYAQLLAFLDDGTISDRSLAVLVKRSGWRAEPLRRALIKPYTIDLALLAAYLRSLDGERFLASQVGSYAPFAAPTKAIEGLRSALLADAADGTLSAAGVMAQLPTDFRLARIPGVASGAMDSCAPDLGALPGQDDQIDTSQITQRRTSLLSWYAFLPACLQERSYRAARTNGVGSANTGLGSSATMPLP